VVTGDTAREAKALRLATAATVVVHTAKEAARTTMSRAQTPRRTARDTAGQDASGSVVEGIYKNVALLEVNTFYFHISGLWPSDTSGRL